MTDSTGAPAPPLPEPDIPDATELVLAGAFPTVGREQWERQVLGVLRKAGRVAEGATPEGAAHALDSVLPGGVTVRGLYAHADALPSAGVPGVAPFTRGATAAGAVRGGWDVRPLHLDPDPVTTHRAVLDDLEGGAGSVWLTVGDGGVDIDALPQVLEGVYVDLAPVVLDAGTSTVPVATAFLALAAERGVADDALLGVLGADPVGLAARTGTAPDLTVATTLASRAAGMPGVRAVVVDALPWAEAGGSTAEQLGLSLATGLAYLRALTDAGLTAEQACATLEFRSIATVDQFATIAALRAARRIWARVTEVSGVAPAARAQRQHAVTSWSMTTAYDAPTNLLRHTIAGFAAGVGGAQAVTVLPFDAALGLPDAFSRRISRNTSTLLVEESHVSAVVDPGGGAWAVEALTDELARAGWAVFTEVERAGGITAALASGLVADRLAASLDAARERLGSGADAVIGVTDFPDLNETKLSRPAAPQRFSGGLPRERVVAPFEALRDRAPAGARVTLLTVGAGKPAAAATTAVANRLRIGGVDATRATADSLADAAGGIVIVCAAADVDAGEVETAAKAAEAAGASLVLLPGDTTGTLDLLTRVIDVLEEK